ncbi:MAG: hypothetical protein AAGF26_11415 [Cyanobacteria bacterium P01_G01_bin.49]
MNDQIDFILKIIISSLGFSIVLKYFAPLITISTTNTNAAIIVIILPLIMTLLLLWRMLKKIT